MRNGKRKQRSLALTLVLILLTGLLGGCSESALTELSEEQVDSMIAYAALGAVAFAVRYRDALWRRVGYLIPWLGLKNGWQLVMEIAATILISLGISLYQAGDLGAAPYDALPLVAVDPIGAGIGETVIIVKGSTARATLMPNAPVDAGIVGIVDDKEVDSRYKK